MADEKSTRMLSTYLTWDMYKNFCKHCKDRKISLAEWNKACGMLNGNGNYPIDEMIKNVMGCVLEVRELKAQDKADKEERKAEREAKKATK